MSNSKLLDPENGAIHLGPEEPSFLASMDNPTVFYERYEEGGERMGAGHRTLQRLSLLWNTQVASRREVDISLTLQQEFFLWVFLDRSKKKEITPSILSWGMSPSLDDFYDQKKSLNRELSQDRTYLSTALEASKTLYRKIDIPLTIPEKDRAAALLDILESTLPPSMSLSSHDEAARYVVASSTRKTTDEAVTYDAYIASREEVLSLSDLACQKEFEAEFVVPKVACLHRWAISSLGSQGTFLIMDVAVSETVLLLVAEGEIQFVRSIPYGLTALQALDLQDAASSSASEQLELFLGSLKEGVESAKEHTSFDPTKVLTGPILASDISSRCISEYVGAVRPPTDQTSLYAVAAEIGAALFGNEESLFTEQSTCPNFLKTNGATNFAKRHIFRPCLLLFTASFIAAITVNMWASYECYKREKEGEQSWKSFQQQVASYPLFETERAKLPQTPPTSLAGQEEVLRDLSDEIQKNGSYPLKSSVPTFSQTISFLDGLIASIQHAHAGEQKVELQSLKYAMLKRPDVKHPKEPYQVRVDVEFVCLSQTLARSFYDALLLSKNFIDTKGDVKWSATNGRYRTTFYLKQI